MVNSVKAGTRAGFAYPSSHSTFGIGWVFKQ